jgi:hypothetical protein
MRIRQADPLGRERRQIRLQVEVGDLDLAAVHHEDNVVDGDGGLGDVGGQDDLAGAGRRPLENGPLGGRRHEAVHRVYHHRTREAKTNLKNKYDKTESTARYIF